MGTFSNALEARDWCQITDEFGDTNFQKVLRTANAMAMEKGRSMITTAELRAKHHMGNNTTPAIIRWLAMADWSLCEYLKWQRVQDLDGENASEFAELFRDFGVKPTSRDHITAKARWMASKGQR